MVTSKLELLVDFGPKPDQNVVNHTLSQLKSHDEVKDAVFKDGAIMVETTLPNKTVLDIVEKSSGKRTVLQGFGESQSAVAMVSSHGCPGSVMGIIRFQQVGDGVLVADGAVDGLPPGGHGLQVRSDGDLSEGCSSLGPVYGRGAGEGSRGAREGALGNIQANGEGRAVFRIVDNVLKMSEIIGRAVAITERTDNLGKDASSKMSDESGPTIACGVIARSAGIFQNPKRICQCDGVLVWDERDRPLAGKGRRIQDGGCCGDHKGRNDTPTQNKPCCKV